MIVNYRNIQSYIDKLFFMLLHNRIKLSGVIILLSILILITSMGIFNSQVIRSVSASDLVSKHDISTLSHSDNTNITRAVNTQSIFKGSTNYLNSEKAPTRESIGNIQQKSTPIVSPTDISVSTAVQIALSQTDQDETLRKIPLMTQYQGIPAYLVYLKDGLIYIDAQNGKILYNSVPHRISEKEASEIVGKFLGGMDPKYSLVKKIRINAVDIYKVTFNVYTVYIDQYGKIIRYQKFEYTGSDTGNQDKAQHEQSSISSPTEESENDHSDKYRDD